MKKNKKNTLLVNISFYLTPNRNLMSLHLTPLTKPTHKSLDELKNEIKDLTVVSKFLQEKLKGGGKVSSDFFN